MFLSTFKRFLQFCFLNFILYHCLVFNICYDDSGTIFFKIIHFHIMYDDIISTSILLVYYSSHNCKKK